jgi:hypothetical protein
MEQQTVIDIMNIYMYVYLYVGMCMHVFARQISMFWTFTLIFVFLIEICSVLMLLRNKTLCQCKTFTASTNQATFYQMFNT